MTHSKELLASFKESSQWPFLKMMLDLNILAYIDYAIAEQLLKPYPSAPESVATLICHLSLSMRAGHLCIHVQKSRIEPEIDQVWVAHQHDDALSAEQYNQIQALILEGMRLLPEQLCAIIEQDDSTPSSLDKPLCLYHDLLYFQRCWHEENASIKGFLKHVQSPPTITLNLDRIEKELLLLPLVTEQASAIRQASRHSLTLIGGGPGTGKTYTAVQIIRLFLIAMDPEQRTKSVIAVAAPTGKAAAHLHSHLQQACQDLADAPKIQSKTLHGLLKKKFGEPSTISADLLIVDESSMIDAFLMSRLFQAIKPGSRVVLIGDPNQLPPVGLGACFREFLTFTQTQYPEHTISLKQCLRTDLKEIISLAEKIQSGKGEEAMEMLAKDFAPIHYRPLPEKEASTYEELIRFASPFFPNIVDEQQDSVANILKKFNQFRLLTPMRHGRYGVEELNRAFLQACVSRLAVNQPFISPILLIANDYRLDLFNGEVGVLVQQNRTGKDLLALDEGDYALFSSRDEEDEVRKIPALLLPRHEYAYCLSIHKSQGSEFNHVLLLMAEGSELFGKELLYTAITRAKRRLDIWGNSSTIIKAASKNSMRLSGMASQLYSKKEAMR